MGADVAQLADAVGIGIHQGRQVVILEQPLEQALQRLGAGRFLNPLLENVSDHRLQHLAGAGQGHLGVQVSDEDRLLHPFLQFPVLVGKVVQTGDQRLV